LHRVFVAILPPFSFLRIPNLEIAPVHPSQVLR